MDTAEWTHEIALDTLEKIKQIIDEDDQVCLESNDLSVVKSALYRIYKLIEDTNHTRELSKMYIY